MPLVWIAVFLSSGVWITNIIRIPVSFSLPAAAISLILSATAVKKKSLSFLLLSAAFFFIGCLLFAVHQIYPRDHIGNFTPSEPKEVYLEGAITDEPRLTATFYGEPRLNFTLDTAWMQNNGIKTEVSGKAKVSLTGETKAPLSYGDRIFLRGKLSKPRGPGNPGEFDYAKYLERNRILSVISGKAQDCLIIKKGGGIPLIRAAYKIRGKIRDLIAGNLSGESANFLMAILLGLRQDIGEDLNDDFMKTGTVHLLAISGLNVGLIAFIILLIFTVMRVPKKAGIAAAIVLLSFYAVLTNGTPSVVRATIMSVVLLFGLLIERESSLWNSLGLAALIILAYDPNALFDIGFQLSFASVISLLYLTPKLEKLFHYDRKIVAPFMGRAKRYLIEGCFVSLAAWIGVLPLILYYFNIVTPISLIANLLAVPLSFLITAASVPFIIFGFMMPPAGKVFAASTWFLCELLFSANGIFAKMPLGHFYLPAPPAILVILYYLFIIAFMERERFKGLSAAKLAAAALAALNVIIWINALTPHDGKMRMTFLDVGRGDSVFLEFPYGGNMLIDGGSGGGQDWDAGRSVILPFLRSKGVQTIDAVVLTHPDTDHVGGLVSVLEGMQVRGVFDNGDGAKTSVYRSFQKVISKKHLARRILKRGDSIEGIKDVTITCLNPPKALASDPSVATNDKSLVLRIAFGGRVTLLCGDIGGNQASEVMLNSPPTISSDLLMLPHHGEKLTSEAEAFIDEADPSFVIISQGKAPNELLRSKEIQGHLCAKGIVTFRTNCGGAVFAMTDGKNLFVDNFESIRKISR